MTASATGTNSLTCLPNHGGARDNKFWSLFDDWPLQTLLSSRQHAECTAHWAIELFLRKKNSKVWNKAQTPSKWRCGESPKQRRGKTFFSSGVSTEAERRCVLHLHHFLVSTVRYRPVQICAIFIIIIIISLLMPPLLGHKLSLWITHKENRVGW
jgi:hypothetical protein